PLAIAGVDLTKPLHGYTGLERPVDAVVDDQPVHARSQRVDPRRQIIEKRRQAPRISQRTLRRPPLPLVTAAHRDLPLLSRSIPPLPDARGPGWRYVSSADDLGLCSCDRARRAVSRGGRRSSTTPASGARR